jgi:hypothetical protein
MLEFIFSNEEITFKSKSSVIMMTGIAPIGATEFYTEQFLKPAMDIILKYPIIKTVANIRVPIFNAIFPHLYSHTIEDKQFYTRDKIMAFWNILEKLNNKDLS